MDCPYKGDVAFFYEDVLEDFPRDFRERVMYKSNDALYFIKNELLYCVKLDKIRFNSRRIWGIIEFKLKPNGNFEEVYPLWSINEKEFEETFPSSSSKERFKEEVYNVLEFENPYSNDIEDIIESIYERFV